MSAFTFNNLIYSITQNGLGESALLPAVLNMSITASVMIVFVLLVRLLLKKAPKSFSYALWAVVLFRLLCPVSITTGFSLLGLFDTPVQETTEHTTVVEYVPHDVTHTPKLEVQLPVVPVINEAVNDALPQKHAALGADPMEGPVSIATVIWLAGMGVMAIYSAVSYFLLRRKLIGAMLLRENIYLADGISSPFVMGFIRPKIYLPSVLSGQEQAYIIFHEQHHIRRGDHLIKALAFIALCIHWFNPLVWVAFVLSSKDMEMSCDEAVVKKLGEDIREDYSASLLSLATGRRIIAGTPLAFGEGDTKSRIKNMLNWKQAKPAVIFLSAAAVILALIVCGTNQKDYTRTADEDTAAYLYRLRGSYRMDGGRVERMLDALEMEELGEYSFEGVRRSEGGLFPRKRYELKVTFPHQPEWEAVFTEEMEHRACILLGLIPNLEQVSWGYPNDGETVTASYFYTALERTEFEDMMATIGELCETEDGLRTLLKHWNLMPETPEEDAMAAMIDWDAEGDYPDEVVYCVKEYVEQQIRHYNDLGSGDNAIGGEYSIIDAKVVNLTKMITTGPADVKQSVELYRVEYRLLPSEPANVVLAGGMQMDGDWITEWGSVGQPYLAMLHDWTTGESVWTLVGTTNTDQIDLDYNTEDMLKRYGDKYAAAAMELYNAYLATIEPGRYGSVVDVSYYLELATGETFRDMAPADQIGLLVEYEDLLDDYNLIARETTDGKSSYIVGTYSGENPENSPLYGMYGVEIYTGEDDFYQLLYREADSATVEEAMAAQKEPSVGYRITDSQIFWSSNSGIILIQPKDNTLSLDVAWSRYLYTPNGREYIADAASRGIDMCSRTEPFLYVYRISERFGEIAERISLTDAEAAAILAEERVAITEGFGFSATLHINGETTYYNERKGIPQTVLDLAVERCDYRFGDPSYITDTIREARLDCDWLDVPLYANEEDLPRLREILKNAEQDYVGACGYGAKLTLTFTGGEKMLVFKGCDSCDSIVFGSYGGYFIGNKENIEFWEMFGLDPDTKARIETNPAEPEELPDEEQEVVLNSPFTAQALSGQSPLNGMFERTYETQLRMMGNIDQSYPFFENQTLEFDTCAVLLGKRIDPEDYSQSGAAYILFRDGAMRQLPLPVDANGRTVCPAYVQQSDSNTLTYTVGTGSSACTYTINLSDRTASMTVGAATTTTAPTAPPAEELVYAALSDKNTENALRTYGAGNLAAADFLTVAYAHLAQEWEDETTYTFYSDVFHAAYALNDGKYDRVDSASVPTKLTFTFADGAWKLSERWMPGSTSSVGVVFPAEAVEILNRANEPGYYTPLPAECDENAIRFYVAQTGVVPYKTFRPANVEFTGQALGATQDEMTYEERLAWVQAGPNYQENYTSLGRYAEGEGCIAYLCTYVGTPHQGAYVLEFRFADGTVANLPLPRDGFWSSALPDTMAFTGGKFVYEIIFPTEELTNEGQTLIHLKGTYRYEVDLAAKTVSLTVLQ